MTFQQVKHTLTLQHHTLLLKVLAGSAFHGAVSNLMSAFPITQLGILLLLYKIVSILASFLSFLLKKSFDTIYQTFNLQRRILNYSASEHSMKLSSGALEASPLSVFKVYVHFHTVTCIP